MFGNGTFISEKSSLTVSPFTEGCAYVFSSLIVLRESRAIRASSRTLSNRWNFASRTFIVILVACFDILRYTCEPVNPVSQAREKSPLLQFYFRTSHVSLGKKICLQDKIRTYKQEYLIFSGHFVLNWFWIYINASTQLSNALMKIQPI